jgi:membrane protease YdiL (CAAX protease family)
LGDPFVGDSSLTEEIFFRHYLFTIDCIGKGKPGAPARLLIAALLVLKVGTRGSVRDLLIPAIQQLLTVLFTIGGRSLHCGTGSI